MEKKYKEELIMQEFMKNTNVYFTQGLMKSVTENGFEIIQRGE